MTIALVAFLTFLLAMTAQGFARELTVFHCWGGEREPWVREMLDGFEARHPGVKVESMLGIDCGSAFREQTAVAMAAGALPDIVMVHSDQIPTIFRGLTPLDGLIERDGIDRGMWFQSEIDHGSWQGTTYALPIRTGADGTNLIFWNKHAFDEVGLNRESPPEVWSELRDTARRLIRYDGETLMRAAGTNITFRQPAKLYAGGGAIYDESARTVTLTTPESRETLAFYRSMAELYRSPQEVLQYTSLNHFLSGNLAMMTGQSADLSRFLTGDMLLGSDVGVGIRPRRTLEDPSGVHLGTWFYAMSPDTPDREIAWELLKWLTIYEESAGYFMLRQGRPSPIRSFNFNPEYFELNPYWHIVTSSMDSVAYVPMFPPWRNANLEYRNLFVRVVAEGAPIESELQNLQSRLQAELDAYWADVQRGN